MARYLPGIYFAAVSLMSPPIRNPPPNISAATPSPTGRLASEHKPSTMPQICSGVALSASAPF